jgi:hypothetical protein
MSTVDLTYGLRAGTLMLDSGTILRTDPFTYSVGGEAWLNQQWLAQILLALVHGAGGWAGLVVVRAVLVGVVCLGVLVGARAGGLGPRASAGLTLVGFAIALPAMALRPQLLGMACFAVLLALLALRRERPRLVWLAIPLTLLWANVHGSFVLAPVAAGVAILADLVDRRPIVPAAALLVGVVVATVVTPWGPGAWTYALELARDPRLRELVTEWQPPSPISYVGIALGLSVVGAVIIIVRVGRRSDWPAVLWIAFLAVLAATSERGVAWWAIGAPIAIAPILARALPARPRPTTTVASEPPIARAFGVGIIAILVTAGGLLVVPWLGADPLLGPEGRVADAPPALTTAARDAVLPGGRLFAAQRWGSWFEWVAPGNPVLVDSRIELFPDAVWDDHLAVSRGDPGWQAILDRWDVAVVVASATEQERLLATVGTDPGWALVAEDADGAVWRRVGAP